MKQVTLLLGLFCGAAAVAAPPTFLARRDYMVGSNKGVATGDFNNDGIPDLASCGGGIQILFGDGSGVFHTGPLSVPSFYCYSIGLSDLNRDGKTDLVLGGHIPSGAYPSGIAALFGNGNGTFGPMTFYQAGSDTYCQPLALGDFNSDQIPDAAILGQQGAWLFPGRADGIFGSPTLTPVPVTYPSLNLVAADFNGDGKLDLAAGTSTGFALLLGNGDGTFRLSSRYLQSAFYPGLGVGDLNRDGHPDLVVASQGFGGYAEILLGHGDGSFAARTFTALQGDKLVALGDVNGDGKLDLVTNAGIVALGNGSGRFGAPVSYPLPGGTQNVLLADLRHSGHLDMVITSEFRSISVLLNPGHGRFLDVQYVIPGGRPYTAAVADFNNDGKPDAAIATWGTVVILLGTGRPLSPFTQGITFEAGEAVPLGVIAGDLNEDGNQDLLVLTTFDVTTYLGAGDGTFTKQNVLTLDNYPRFGILADFNKDGHLDVAVTGNRYALGNGDGTFQTPRTLVNMEQGPNLDILVAGDFNRDGALDIAVTKISFGVTYVMLGNGDGTFQQTSFFNISPDSVKATADFNGDGILDLAFGSTLSHVPIYLGNGDGTFRQGTTIELDGASSIAPLLATDLNGDGMADISGAVNHGSSYAVVAGKGDGTFRSPVYYGLGPLNWWIETGNFHRQAPTAGTPDIIFTDDSGFVGFLLNTTKTGITGLEPAATIPER